VEVAAIVFTSQLLLVLYVHHDALLSKFDVHQQIFLLAPINWHTVRKDLLLAFFVFCYNSFNEFVVHVVHWRQSVEQDLFKLPFQTF